MTSHLAEFPVYKVAKHYAMIFYFLMAILGLQNRRTKRPHVTSRFYRSKMYCVQLGC